MKKPAEIFDRDAEWSALTRFASSGQPGATMGVVSGRRRQGKTYLLQALCKTTGGFYFSAEEGTETESLRYLGAAIASFIGAPAPLQLADWRQAWDVLLSLGNDREIPIVIDEFPYLVRASPALPSILQGALAPMRPERQQSRARLLLCGSAMSFMGSLLSGNAPLRGRAGLELVVPTLDFRLAAEFWNVTDAGLAVRVNSIVGGTPAYRREFAANDTPNGPADFDDWVCRTVLNVSSPLFREARYLLAEEPDLRDPGLYHSVLAAVADGNNSRGGIANYLGRRGNDIAHPLALLEDIGLLARDVDVFRSNRTFYRIAEPLVTFYHAIMRPVWAELERPQNTTRVWTRSQARYLSKVVGPHFERLCRTWALHFSEPDVFGGYPTAVGSGVVNDPARKTSHEVDVAVFRQRDTGANELASIGEVKWGDTMGLGHLDRLRRIRTLLLGSTTVEAGGAALACYSGVGFTDELRTEAARSGDVLLIDAAQLYP